MEPVIYPEENHGIIYDDIDPDALFVLDKLHEAGYIAYLVGGGVRDLLVHKKPKDFDISTSAEPEEIKKLFRRDCVLIGRRFRLAHIRFGRKIIEVSTFRAGDSAVDELIVRDNVWGTPEQDVTRRDFTINGLFYDPQNRTVIDYVGGGPDINNHVLRAIGDAHVRFRQDPVRMIRLLKFRARFGFTMDPESIAAVAANREELLKASPARVTEELFRMLESGAAEPFFRLMMEHRLLELLLPEFATFLSTEHAGAVYALLRALDQRIQDGILHHPDRAILSTCLLFPILELKLNEHFIKQDLVPHLGQILSLASEVIEDYMGHTFCNFPKRIRATMHFILGTQYRIFPLGPKRPRRTRIVKHLEFPLALTFFRLRSLVDTELEGDYRWWKSLMISGNRSVQRHRGDRKRQARRPQGPRKKSKAQGL